MISYLDSKLQNMICNENRNYIHIKTMEEVAELIRCITEINFCKNHLAEEICDVYICLYRLKRINYIKSNPPIDFNPTLRYDNVSIVNTLASFQQLVSKNYLYNYSKRNFINSIDNMYSVLYYLMYKYDIESNVNSWIAFKEERDRRLVNNGFKWNKQNKR